MLRLLVLGLVIASLVSAAADAKTLHWANRGDPQTTDPHSQNEGLTNNLNELVYEFLVGRDKNLKLVPKLAVSWQQIDPVTWRFKLRPGVSFHDGTPFTADDVVFSYQRARADTSQLRVYANAAGIPKKIDDLTVEFTTNGPNPIELEHIATINIMSKAWCEKNHATKPQNFTQKEEMITAHQANGTGPYMLKSREPDVKTVLVKNPNWWGLKDEPIDIDEADFNRIENAATRVSALLSGELDMVYTVPPQDIDRIANTPGMKIWQTNELRTIFLGMDQSRDELLESNVKGKNPFKDKRVRQAFYQAIDENAIAAKVMRGYAHPTGLMIGPGVNGYDSAIDKRFPYDPVAAKKLLADAGYPDGFEVGFDCPNDRYVNDEGICQAVVAMLAKIGVKADLLAQTRAKYFAKINAPHYDTSFYMLGWTPGTYDALDALKALVATRGPNTKDGTFNIGGYSNPQIDDLISKIQIELDKEKRNEEIRQALLLLRDDFGYIPLHQQVVVWATRDSVDLAQTGDNFFQLRYVKMK